MGPPKRKNRKIKKVTSTVTSTSAAASGSSAGRKAEVGGPIAPILPGGPYQANPYQCDGPKNAFEAKTVKQGIYVRVDMPGVGQDTVKVSWEDKKLSYWGEAPKDSEYECAPRYYRGVIDFSSEPAEVAQVKVDMNNGVLRMLLVGSGFTPDFYSASTHSASVAPELPQYWEVFSDNILLRNQQFQLFNPPANFLGKYPYQVGGTLGTYEAYCLDDGYCFMRVDMPDVGSEGLSVKFKDRCLIYFGRGEEASDHDESPRQYFGKFTMQCPCSCKISEVKGEIKNGVLRMLIKKETCE